MCLEMLKIFKEKKNLMSKWKNSVKCKNKIICTPIYIIYDI